MRQMKNLLLAGVLAFAVVAGCDDAPQATSPTPQPAAADAVPDALVLAEAPADPKNIADVRKGAKNGDEVVLRGRVGGTAKPFGEGRAIVQLVDLSVPHCADNPADKCETPWDYCCSPEAKDNSVSVQVVDASGRPLKANLEGVGGMKPLSEVVVTGKVQRLEGSDAVVVNATGVYVKKG